MFASSSLGWEQLILEFEVSIASIKQACFVKRLMLNSSLGLDSSSFISAQREWHKAATIDNYLTPFLEL